jgi:hypothetical protein
MRRGHSGTTTSARAGTSLNHTYIYLYLYLFALSKRGVSNNGMKLNEKTNKQTKV